MPDSLLNKYHAYPEIPDELDGLLSQVRGCARECINFAIQNGLSSLEVQAMIMDGVSSICCETRLLYASKLIKEERRG